MIRIQQIKLPPEHEEDELIRVILNMLHIQRENLLSYTIVRRSIDARKKNDIRIVYVIDVALNNEAAIFKRQRRNKNFLIPQDTLYQFPKSGVKKLMHRPIIIGTGPAGLFCGLLLAENGYRPILLERGEEVEKRFDSVTSFWKTGILNPESNVQFGEGGAGTFSDGKLNTLVKDTFGRNKKVLEIFVQAGAPEDILYNNKPHIGTDILRLVVKNIRKRIEILGGEVHFESKVTDFYFESFNNRRILKGIRINNEQDFMCDTAVLAIGHSARDTFQILNQKKIEMLPKSFAVGLRIEHPQKLINIAQFGEADNPYLPPADYKLTYQATNGRSVYSFCMCPGGYVVNAASEPERIAVNGMSYRKRDGINANSALIVSVTPEDFHIRHALAGMEFQKILEERAYHVGQGKIPIQLWRDFEQKCKSTGIGEVKPNLKGAYEFADLNNILPEYVSFALKEGIKVFGRKIKDFDREDAVLSGVESRTSSPVRIVRDEHMQSNVEGLYPCGEGAGYAGGITSAAMDGMKVAEAIAKRYRQ